MRRTWILAKSSLYRMASAIKPFVGYLPIISRRHRRHIWTSSDPEIDTLSIQNGLEAHFNY